MDLTLSPASTKRTGASQTGKILIAVLIFLSIISFWFQFGGAIRRMFPLPGGQGPGGTCAIWAVGSSTLHKWTTMSEDMAPWITQNRGVNGASVEDVAARLQAETVVSHPGTVIVYIGENDIARGSSGEETALKVSGMVKSLRSENQHAHIIVLGMKPSPTRWVTRSEQLRFNGRIAELLKPQRNTVFVDFGNRFLVDGLPGPYYDEQGIHLNADGYRIWARETRQVVERTLPQGDVDRCTGTPRPTT